MKNGKPKSDKIKNKTDAPKKAADAPIFDAEMRRAQLRVAKARDKLRLALDDPEKRKQMVEAIRAMMRSEE